MSFVICEVPVTTRLYRPFETAWRFCSHSDGLVGLACRILVVAPRRVCIQPMPRAALSKNPLSPSVPLTTSTALNGLLAFFEADTPFELPLPVDDPQAATSSPTRASGARTRTRRDIYSLHATHYLGPHMSVSTWTSAMEGVQGPGTAYARDIL